MKSFLRDYIILNTRCFCSSGVHCTNASSETNNKNNHNRSLLYSAILCCTQTHCAFQHSPTYIYTTDDVPLVEFMCLVFTRMPGESYRRRLRSLFLCLCDVFRALINSLVCWFCTSALSLVLFQIYTYICQSSVSRQPFAFWYFRRTDCINNTLITNVNPFYVRPYLKSSSFH